MSDVEILEKGGSYQWENIPEDPVMSRISVHVYCAYEKAYGKEWRRGLIRNHYDRLYFVESGEAVVCTPEQEVTLRPGCSYLIASNQLHRHFCTSAISMHWCHFQAVLDGTSDLFQEFVVPMEARPKNPERYRATFKELEETMNCRQPWCHLLRASLLLQLIQPHLKQAEPALRNADETRRRFQPVLRHIDTHLNEDLRVEELAEQLGLNKEYFSRAFSRHFRIPPKKYILLKRIQSAQKLLCYSELQIQEIGARCGFPDPYHFSKIFKQIAGIPPSEYRRMYRQEKVSVL